MKGILSLFFLLLCTGITYGQSISEKFLIGKWQISTAKTGSALLAHYDFFPDGNFTYTFDAYDDRGRITSAGGTYKLNGGKLLLYIKYRVEIMGGELVQGGMGFQQEEIVLEGGKSVKIPQSTKAPIEVLVEVRKTNRNLKCIKLQNNVYYQISKVPGK